jgi:hypothetical protein
MTKGKLILYEFLACPAHLWLTILAWLMGGRFTCGPTDDAGNIIDQKDVD